MELLSDVQTTAGKKNRKVFFSVELEWYCGKALDIKKAPPCPTGRKN